MTRPGRRSPQLFQPDPFDLPYSNSEAIAPNLGVAAGRILPVVGVGVAVVVTVTSDNPLRTGIGQAFGFVGGGLGGAAGIAASAPTGGLAVPITGTAGAIAGSALGNKLGLALYDAAASGRLGGPGQNGVFDPGPAY